MNRLSDQSSFPALLLVLEMEEVTLPDGLKIVPRPLLEVRCREKGEGALGEGGENGGKGARMQTHEALQHFPCRRGPPQDYVLSRIRQFSQVYTLQLLGEQAVNHPVEQAFNETVAILGSTQSQGSDCFYMRFTHKCKWVLQSCSHDQSGLPPRNCDELTPASMQVPRLPEQGVRALQ